jgi:hypothetical protein
MRVLLATLSAAFLVAACQTPCPAPETGPVTSRFVCEDGSQLTVTFTRNPDLARIEEEGYAPLTVPARIAGSGYNYTGGGAELRRRGAETTWTRPGAAPTMCSQSSDNGQTEENDLPRDAMVVGRNATCPGSDVAQLWQRMRTSAS